MFNQLNIKQLKAQDEEIQEIKFVPIKKIEEDLRAGSKEYLPHGDYWAEIIKEIKKRISS